jgi:hypothetical protein
MTALPARDQLIRELIAGRSADSLAAGDGSDPVLLVAAALVAGDPGDLLDRATAAARTGRDRQLVAIAAAHLRGDRDRALLLARDHLADHPDDLLVAHIASLATQH